VDAKGRQEVGLFRYGVIRDAADPGLSKAERGRLVRARADREHVGPHGTIVRIGRTTIDRWIRAYRQGGFQALIPRPRVVLARTPSETLELAFRLKRERPERTAAQVREVMLAAGGPAPGLRTLQTHLAREGLLTDTQDGDGGVALDGDEVVGNDRTTERLKWWWVGNGLR
jgi:putative transposase